MATQRLKSALAIVLMLGGMSVEAEPILSLERAIEMAHERDLWPEARVYEQAALEAEGQAAAILPAPRVSLGLLNLPTDSFDFDQEGMTQLKFGVSQALARGDSLRLKQAQSEARAERLPWLRDDRHAKRISTVSSLWLKAYAAQTSMTLIEQNQALFEQVQEVLDARYISTLGRARQPDLIRARLERVQLQERWLMQQQQRDTALAQLQQWLYATQTQSGQFGGAVSIQLPAALPEIPLHRRALLETLSPETRNDLAQVLLQHPLLRAKQAAFRAAEYGVSLAKQADKPQWRVNASYAHRAETPMGADRADLVSLGFSVDLPMLTRPKQDHQRAATVARAQAVKTDQQLLLQRMVNQVESAWARFQTLQARHTLYQSDLLQQSQEQAEAELSAYTHDDGAFVEVVRARVAELNTQLAALDVSVQRLQTIVQLNYLFAPPSEPKGERG